MVGDTSDNIPGVKGIGEKGGAKLIQQYGSLEGVYGHLDELPKGQRASLEAGRDIAFLSRALSRIVIDVPGVKLDLEACRTHDFDRDEVLRLFRELEFRSLYNRIPGGPPASPAAAGAVQLSMFETAAPARLNLRLRPAHTAAASQAGQVSTGAATDYQIVTTPEALADLASRLRAAGRFTFDVETTSTDAVTADLVGLAITDAPGRGYYIPVAPISSL